MTEREAKEQVASIMARCYERGLTTSTGGNCSCRIGEYMTITPSGKDKRSLKAEDIALLDINSGKVIGTSPKLSIETEMHRRIYLKRSDINAVVHSHPVYSCLFSASEEDINISLIAESWYLLGDRMKKVPYALMGTELLAESVADYSATADVLLLENHGAVALGRTLLEAFDRLECLEQAAKLTVLSHIIPARGISEIQKKEINEMRK